MESTSWIIVLLCLISSAFFSGVEMAFVSSNKLKAELDSKGGGLTAKIVGGFMKRPSFFIASMLLGNNVALVIYSVYMAVILEPAIIHLVGDHEAIVLLLQTVISTILILVTAEFLPKSIFHINPNGTLKLLAVPTFIVNLILYVPTSFVMFISNLLIKRVFGREVEDKVLIFGRIDLDNYLKERYANSKTKEQQDHEIQIFQNALEFLDVKVRECMIPRTEIVAMEVNNSVEELKEQYINTGLSKIIIYRDTIDNVIGYTHSFELFKSPETIASILIPTIIVPESMSANEVLKLFILQRRSMAVVVDEFGGTSGILTMEDVIEEIFGEIEDEHDKEDLIEKKLSEFQFIFSARLEVDYLNEKYRFNIPIKDDYETLAGFVIDACESIPKLNDSIEIGDFIIKILKVSGNKIDTIKLELKEQG